MNDRSRGKALVTRTDVQKNKIDSRAPVPLVVRDVDRGRLIPWAVVCVGHTRGGERGHKRFSWDVFGKGHTGWGGFRAAAAHTSHAPETVCFTPDAQRPAWLERCAPAASGRARLVSAPACVHGHTRIRGFFCFVFLNKPVCNNSTFSSSKASRGEADKRGPRVWLPPSRSATCRSLTRHKRISLGSVSHLISVPTRKERRKRSFPQS